MPKTSKQFVNITIGVQSYIERCRTSILGDTLFTQGNKGMKASNKSLMIDKMLTAFTGKDRKETVVNNLCMLCSKEADLFKDDISRKEYLISGMCQTCQDEVF
jgi:hypothetical protein